MARHAHAHTEHEGDDLIGAARHTLTNMATQWTAPRTWVIGETARSEKPPGGLVRTDSPSHTHDAPVETSSRHPIPQPVVRN